MKARAPFSPLLLLLVLAAALAWQPALAQDRSATGRHVPPPPPPSVAEQKASAPRTGRWFGGFGAGVGDGSDLFRVETASGFPVPWDPATGGGFTTARFRTRLDAGPALNLYLGYRLGEWVSLRADLMVASMEVSAEAKAGQGGAVYRFDTFGVTTYGLVAETRLVRRPSHPFVGLGLTLVHLGPDHARGLAQTNLGGQLSLGWLQRLGERWDLRLEGRASRSAFSMGDYVPQTTLDNQPELIIDSESGLTLVALLLSAQVTF